MSTKFNRDDANAVDDQMFLDDYTTDMGGLETDIMDTRKDFHAPSIVYGLFVFNNAVPDQYVNIADDPITPTTGGIAYDEDGYRIDVSIAQANVLVDVTLDAINYVCVRYLSTESESRIAYKTGETWNGQLSGSFEVVVKTEAEGIETGDVCLATTTGTGAAVTLDTNDRQQPDYSESTESLIIPKVTGLQGTTGAGSTLVDDFIEFEFDDTPDRAYITLDWVSLFDDVIGITGYEISLIPYLTVGGEQESGINIAFLTYDNVPLVPTRNYYTFHNLEPGVIYRSRVRVIDVNGNKGTWSDYLDVTAGITGHTQLTMAGGLVLTSVAQGIRVQWGGVTDAKGYVLFTQVGSYPGETDYELIVYQGKGRDIVVPADTGVLVYVLVRAYDAVGWRSSDTLTGVQGSGTPA